MDYSQTFKSIGEAFGYALPTSALGFLTVFGVLALLWGILEIFKIVFYTIPNKRKAAVKAKPAEEPTAVPETAENGSEEEIVAAIMGAISAYRAANGESAGGFRVVSFKKRA